MIFAKKSLGQNFLTNTGIVSSIVDAGLVSSGDTILEIGPGRGILTEELLKRGARVIAIEKDAELIPLLQEKFRDRMEKSQLSLIYEDILNFNFSPKEPYKLIANIPYYITGLIIRKFLTSEKQPEKMVLLVQKEVAERIIAQNGKESLLSISVKAYGTPTYIKTVKAGSFTPAPKVDSAILLIDSISHDFFKGISEERFFKILHAGFAHKRKQLFGNLKAIFKETELKERMKGFGIPENIRAEDMLLENWKKLCEV
ncbi:MAG: 16S rRNA (adenine(1518)-N(6)/adenine(1519)-N(6))-dimethyltransferase RsmA [Candidatus Parcubacteria bacterium]|nr:16S rRNA (adenine(1518)-N(6)/adenine(1519)-N(6))-dimethyltransferase RsmA [Candidatus Parcubacteria bacterium]